MRNKRHSKSSDFYTFVVFSETLSRLSCSNNASYFSALLTNTLCNFYDFSTHFLFSFLNSSQPALILLPTITVVTCMHTRHEPVSTLSRCLSLSPWWPYTHTHFICMYVYTQPGAVSVVHMGTNTLTSVLAVNAVKEAAAE